MDCYTSLCWVLLFTDAAVGCASSNSPSKATLMCALGLCHGQMDDARARHHPCQQAAILGAARRGAVALADLSNREEGWVLQGGLASLVVCLPLVKEHLKALT